MAKTESLTHPAVEIQLPIEAGCRQYVIPTETTLFLWQALGPGTANRLAPSGTTRGKAQMDVEAILEEQTSWAVSLDGQAVPLLRESPYRNSGYRGIAWWTAIDSVELPAELTVQFRTGGDQPTIDEVPLVCWTATGRRLSWNQVIESTITLQAPDNSARDFETHRETLWNRHSVYKPRRE